MLAGPFYPILHILNERYYSSLLIGNSENDQQQQGKPIRSGGGRQGGSQQKSSNSICQGFDVEFLAEAFGFILMAWIKRLTYQHRLSPNQIKDASVTILPYGSYGLGIH